MEPALGVSDYLTFLIAAYAVGLLGLLSYPLWIVKERVHFRSLQFALEQDIHRTEAQQKDEIK